MQEFIKLFCEETEWHLSANWRAGYCSGPGRFYIRESEYKPAIGDYHIYQMRTGGTIPGRMKFRKDLVEIIVFTEPSNEKYEFSYADLSLLWS